ncbi:hypothetical protein PAXRUDRAFT_836471 [Paxillus rubicundulus Ve08.2h10]|uniref:Uncharacterized protein n=1 Tax=Paxillus rubicundulus Ve08.2h10 TaxID=930991 RepID=A0A0D0D6A4_9AGAM|nr:hypothetical protein PAXRUDRAFT_836471 [Paxillus rubicundulus Ve08.2h10]
MLLVFKYSTAGRSAAVLIKKKVERQLSVKTKAEAFRGNVWVYLFESKPTGLQLLPMSHVREFSKFRCGAQCAVEDGVATTESPL